MTSNARKRQLAYQASNGSTPEKKRTAAQERTRIAALERRLRSGS